MSVDPTGQTAPPPSHTEFSPPEDTGSEKPVSSPGLAIKFAAGALATATVNACGGGGGGGGGGGSTSTASTANLPTSPVAPAITTSSESARFLNQASFGTTEAELQNLSSKGYDQWFAEQFNAPMSLQVPYCNFLAVNGIVPRNARVHSWIGNAIVGSDQLRQRVAFALSQIFVVSQIDLPSDRERLGLANYYDMLMEHAFGNYRDLLQAVTLSPIMGRYLSMVRNEKPDPARGIRPDENYAREVMQLFSIGLVELNLDGTVKLDSNNEPIPTYDQETIEGFAHVFTGWTYSDSTQWTRNGTDYQTPMKAFESFHDTGTKKLLGTATLPANQDALTDLEAALDNIFNHPNVAPFICRQLIQRLVTSNPTPGYVRRVAERFEDNGQGVRGDFKAVIRQILLDDEARNGPTLMPNTFGKVREPLIRQIAVWRALKAGAANGRFEYNNPERDFGQAPLRAPSVFNFFRPDYRQPGMIDSMQLESPEFSIMTESNATATTNRFYANTFWRYLGRSNVDSDDILINIETEKALASDPDDLVDHLDLLLLGGRMPADMRQILVDHVMATSHTDDGSKRVTEVIYLIITSPEFSIQQ